MDGRARATHEEMKPDLEIKADATIDWLNKEREERVQFVQGAICQLGKLVRRIGLRQS